VSKPTVLLLGSRVRLTAIEQDDAATIARWGADSEFLRFYDTRPAYPPSEAEVADRLDKLIKDKRTIAFGIRPLDSDELIGTVELDGIIWAHGVCGIAIAIGDRQNRGKGYGSEAVELALAFAFNELNLHRITATVFSYNERSMAMIERLGFRREGAFREFLQRDGERYDMLLYGLLRPEWRRHRGQD